jgi:hypothetical protein
MIVTEAYDIHAANMVAWQVPRKIAKERIFFSLYSTAGRPMMTQEQALDYAMKLPISPGRKLDILIAHALFGYQMRLPNTPWYPVQIIVFYADDGTMMYSFDQRSCNAMMFKNGVDDRDGTVPALPMWCEDLTHTDTILAEMRDRGWSVSIHGMPGRDWQVIYNKVGEVECMARADQFGVAVCAAALLTIESARPVVEQALGASRT